MVHLTVCSCHVTNMFPSESTFYSCLNAKELLTPNRHKIWGLSDCNCTQTHNDLVHKQTPNHLAKLAKWLSCILSTYLYGAFDCMFLSLWNVHMTWQEHLVKYTIQISTHNTAQSLGLFGYMVECFFTNLVVVGSSPVAVT